MTFKEKYIADKGFYKRVLDISLPIMIQNMLSNALGTIDTMMVSWIGMVSAVGTAGQISSVVGITIWGSTTGANIFASQYFGANDTDHLKKTFGYSVLFGCSIGLIWLLICALFGRNLIAFYINDAETIQNAYDYLKIAMFAYPIMGLSYSLSSTFRCIQRQDISLKCSIAVGIFNTVMNYLLINGIWVFPQMGVQGAALATLLAEISVCIFYFVYSINHNVLFFGSFKEMFIFPWSFCKNILIKTIPLIVNETLFSIGSTLFVKAFGYLGKESMDAYYVGNQIFNLFMFIVYGYGNSVAILLGQTLGQNHVKEAKQHCHYFEGLSAFMSLIIVIVMTLFAHPLVILFGLKDSNVVNLAIWIVRVLSLKVALRMYNYMMFSILRSGGDSKIITLLDCGLVWMIGIPVAFFCVLVLKMDNIVLLLLIVQVEQLIRMMLGMRRIHSGIWAQNLTN